MIWCRCLENHVRRPYSKLDMGSCYISFCLFVLGFNVSLTCYIKDKGVKSDQLEILLSVCCHLTQINLSSSESGIFVSQIAKANTFYNFPHYFTAINAKPALHLFRQRNKNPFSVGLYIFSWYVRLDWYKDMSVSCTLGYATDYRKRMSFRFPTAFILVSFLCPCSILLK